MKLYEITQTHNQAFIEMAEIDDLDEKVINDTLEMLEGDFKDKALSVAAYFQNEQAEVLAMKEAEKRIADRRKSKEKNIAWMKDYLLQNMQRTGITKIECPEYKITIRNNPQSVNVIDELLIPDNFKEYVEVLKIDKPAIKKAGGCEGVELVRGQSIQIK